MKEKIINEENLGEINGGLSSQTQEIIDYVREHDPSGYAFICNSKRPIEWALLRYLVDKGVPLLTMAEYESSNSYHIGDWDNDRQISHSELMELVRQHIN